MYGASAYYLVNAAKPLLFSVSTICLCYTGYSWSIRRVFTEYSYVSVMYRLCIGYASVICRNMVDARGHKSPKILENLQN